VGPGVEGALEIAGDYRDVEICDEHSYTRFESGEFAVTGSRSFGEEDIGAWFGD